jgi:hypothetical protein
MNLGVAQDEWVAPTSVFEVRGFFASPNDSAAGP